MTQSTKDQGKAQSNNSETLQQSKMINKNYQSVHNENQELKSHNPAHFKAHDYTSVPVEEKHPVRPGRSTMDDMQHGRLMKNKDGNTYELIFSTNRSH